MGKKILWIDDEIHFFRAHIEFLKRKDYDITAVTNGYDGIELLEKDKFDLILLDEMMDGIDGLETLSKIRQINYDIPVVMITKNEDEQLMQSAIGQNVTDFLTKPVNASQIQSVFIKVFNSRELQQNKAIENLQNEFNRIRTELLYIQNTTDWIKMYQNILRLELQNESIDDDELKNIFKMLKEEVNIQFANFIKKNYVDLLVDSNETLFSHQFIPKVVFPEIKKGRNVYFFILDCMRADQWLAMTPIIKEMFEIETNYYLSILPTATPYSRNAIFSGKLPLILHQQYPNLIPWFKETETGKNDDEYDLLLDLMKEYKIDMKSRPYFTKILDITWAGEVYKKLESLIRIPFVVFVFNFLDIIIHHRANSKILQEIVFDESAFRAIAKNWFEKSWIFRILKYIAENDKGATIILSTDHGSIQCNKPLVITGDSKISYSLRFKVGNYLKTKEKSCWLVKDSEKLFLPKNNVLTDYSFAMGNSYFAFSGNVGQFSQKYNNNFFHGGISMEEMILPYSILRSKL